MGIAESSFDWHIDLLPFNVNISITHPKGTECLNSNKIIPYGRHIYIIIMPGICHVRHMIIYYARF